MGSRVPHRGRVAAPDLAAGEAQSQVHPWSAEPEALLDRLGCRVGLQGERGDRDGRLERSECRAGKLIERWRDIGARRDGSAQELIASPPLCEAIWARYRWKRSFGIVFSICCVGG